MNIYNANISDTNREKVLWNYLGMSWAVLALAFTLVIVLCSLTITFIVAKLLSFSSGIDREIEARISRIRLIRYTSAFSYLPTLNYEPALKYISHKRDSI